MEPCTILLENKQKSPLYEQIYQFIRQEIQSGRVRAPEKLPSKRELARHLSVSVNTVETAYAQLEAEGYVAAKPKQGFFVLPWEAPPMPQADLPSPLPEDQEIKDKTAIRYDLRTNAVDTRFFPYATWAKISKQVMYHQPELLEVGDGQGDLCLRQAIAKTLHESRGISCSPEQVIVGAGSEYLMSLVLQILGKGQIYAMENPCYPKTYQILKNEGVPISLLPLDEGGLSMEHLKYSGANVAMVTPSHQFPTGIVMPIQRRNQLLQWAGQEEGRYIVEDDYDSEFRFSGKPIPALQGLDQNEKVIYLSTFSKSIAPSLRFGYLVLPLPLLRVYQARFKEYSSTVSRFEQHTLYHFIESGAFGRHLNKLRTLYRSRRNQLLCALRKAGNPLSISGESTGMRLLLQVHNGMEEHQLLESAARTGIRLDGIRRHYLAHREDAPASTVLLGYANLQEEEIPLVAEKLMQAWFPERK